MASLIKNLTTRYWIILVLLLQILALGFIAAKREWIHSTGNIVYLRTAPVDPRDLFRGDYVQLQYEITQPESALLSADWLKPDALQKTGYQQVYLQLERDTRGIASVTRIAREQPAGLFIKGHIDPHWNRWDSNTFIKLGIEKYFVEQGTGLALEEQRGRGEDWQTPMEMEVALGNDGTALIRGFRWSDMSVRLEVVEAGQNPNNVNRQTTADAQAVQTPPRLSPKLRISVRNQSIKPVTFVDSSAHCAFNLVENRFQPVGSGQSLNIIITPNRTCDDSVTWLEHTLPPGKVYSFEIDMADTQWHITVNDKTQEIGALQNRWDGFRWIYQLPEKERASRSGRHDVWVSSLRTTRFNAGGSID